MGVPFGGAGLPGAARRVAELGWRLLPSLVLAVGLLGCGSPSGLGAGSASADDPEQRVIALVNNERAHQGLGALTLAPELTSSARAYAHQLASQGFFSHVAPDGTTFVMRSEAAGYRNWTYLEENLAAGQTTPEQAVAAWMASPSHREDILSPNVRETGVGFTVLPGSPYIYYWVQEFGDRPSIQRVSFDISTASVSPAQVSWQAPTGHRVNGDWLGYVESHGFIDGAGLPRPDVFADPLVGGLQTQYFQRMVLEWHPENAAGQKIQRRLLGDVLYPGADPATSPDDA